jgi:hypothetical protein
MQQPQPKPDGKRDTQSFNLGGLLTRLNDKRRDTQKLFLLAETAPHQVELPGTAVLLEIFRECSEHLSQGGQGHALAWAYVNGIREKGFLNLIKMYSIENTAAIFLCAATYWKLTGNYEIIYTALQENIKIAPHINQVLDFIRLLKLYFKQTISDKEAFAVAQRIATGTGSLDHIPEDLPNMLENIGNTRDFANARARVVEILFSEFPDIDPIHEITSYLQALVDRNRPEYVNAVLAICVEIIDFILHTQDKQKMAESQDISKILGIIIGNKDICVYMMQNSKLMWELLAPTVKETYGIEFTWPGDNISEG